MTKWKDEEEKTSNDFWLFVICIGILCLFLIVLIPFNIDCWQIEPQRLVMLDSMALMAYYLLVRIILWVNHIE